jgi:hypothetical protein
VLAIDGFRETPSQQPMMVHFGEPQLFKGQRPQLAQGVLYAQLARLNPFQHLAQSLEQHRHHRRKVCGKRAKSSALASKEATGKIFPDPKNFPQAGETGCADGLGCFQPFA